MINTDNIPSVSLHTKVYSQFLGVDFTTDDTNISDSRSPDALNLITDAAGFPEKRPGWRVLQDYSCEHEERKIHGLHYAHIGGKAAILVHAGSSLYAFDPETEESTIICQSVHDGPSTAFAHGGYLYFLDGEHYYRISYTPTQYSILQVSGIARVPTTGVGGHYEAKTTTVNGEENTTYTWVPCEDYEEPNILTSKQINTLAGDGVNKDFWLSYAGCSVSKVEILNGETWTVATGYTTTEDSDRGKTKLTFTTAPAAHAKGAGIDNIKVYFVSSKYTASPGTIEKCTISTQYGYFNDNRFFISGNPDKPHMDWACAVDDPTYWELNQWTKVGSDQTAIRGYLHYGDALAIVKEDDNQDAEIYIRTAQETEDNKVLYPVQQGIKGVGAASIHAFATLRDDPMFLAKEGIFAIAGTDASQQRTVQNRSYFVDNRLKMEARKEDACAIIWDGKYLVAFPESKHCYVADARMRSGMNESYVYEWNYWDNIPARRFLEFDGNLYFGTEDGRLCKMNTDLKSMQKYADGLIRVTPVPDDTSEYARWTGGDAIRARWTTKADVLGTIAKTKTMTKRGCTVMLKPYSLSSVTMRFTSNKAIDEDIREVILNVWDFAELDFSRIDFNAIEAPQVVALSKKVKKFAFLQLIFENTKKNEAFGLYRIDVQYFINNYIK